MHKKLGLTLLVITSSLSIFLGVGWRKASAIVQTTSSRLDQINSDYAIETREELYDEAFVVETSRLRIKELCKDLKGMGIYLNERDLFLCGK